MADLDELQIKITSSSKDAEEAIDKLVKSLKGLNTAIGSLDASKVNSFASAMSKLANIGANTNTTSKAIKGMAGDIASAFGIRTKKGIDDIVASLEALYKATRNVNLNGSAENNNIYANSQKNLQDAIEANYEYKEAIDETTKSIAEYVKAQNKSGQKIAMAAMAEEYGEDFRNLTKVLGKSFNNKLKASEGATDLAKFFEDMNSALNTDFKTGNMQELKESVDMLVVSLQNAKEKTYDFRTAISSGLISGEEAAESVMNISDKIWALIKEQDKYGASSGLGGLVDVFKQISNVQVPDLSSLEKLKNIDVSKVASQVSNIGTSATRSQQEVENLVASLSKVETVIEGNEIKNYERGFTMKDVAPIKNVEFPPALYEQVDFFQEKMLPAIIDTENEIENLLMHMMAMSSVEPIYDAITEKFIEWKTQLMEMNGAIGGNRWATSSPMLALPEFDKMLPAVVEVKDNYRQLFEADLGIDRSTQMFRRMVESLGVVESASEETKDSFEKLGESFEGVSKSSDDFNSFLDNINEITSGIEENSEQIQSSIEKILESIRNYKQVISDMESGKTAFDKTQYDEAVRGYSEATNALKNYKNELLGVEKEEQKAGKVNIFGDVLSNLVALGHELKHVSEGFEKLANIGIKTLKIAFTPLNHVVQEYKEKFDDLRDSINGFVSNIKTNLKKMSDFWKRSMRTFTFMVIRTAITAIIKEVGNAVQSLAMYSNAMGTAFNTDLSNMVADFQYLGRSIVSVFAPLLNFITPIIDAITDRIATLISYIGMLFAALGGKATFTKAKKNVTNYAESLDSASKSAKNLTMGIDELNIISENKGGGGAKPYDGWENAWEDVEIPQWIVDFSDKLKDIFDKVFDPLKTAWDRAKQYVLDGFKTMVNSLKRLFSDIGRDFLEVWNQEKTIHMFEQLFKIIGDILRVVRNLADALDEAWNHNKTGLKILENIRDIFYILVEHARNISYYMVEWSKKIDFKPLLTSFETLTKKAKKLADFVGGVIEDIFVYGILKYIKYLIEDALPHLNKTIAKIIDAFNFKTIRKNLQPVISAIEKMMENIHTGTVDAIGNIGLAVAKFTNSQVFTDFLQRVVDLTELITAERVEKVLTALGTAIINVAEAVIRFINSDAFMKFLEALADWIDNHSVDEIAGILEAIGIAVLGFKFGEFALDKLSGFFQFFSVLTALKNLGTIAKEMTELGAATKVAGEGAEILGASSSTLSGFAAVLGGIGTALGSIITAFLEFHFVSDGVEELKLALNGDEESSLVGALVKVIATVGIATAAFTALLGFPAGVIAAGVVGAIAALKGIDDAIQQINFDRVTDAILTQGDTTVEKINEWYDQATETVRNNVTEWKNIERDLVQGRGDIDAYGESIKGLTSAFQSHVQLTTGASSQLVSAYQDMGNCINNYIDTSTQSMISNIEAQRGYLEAQGYDVNEMIANLLVGADEQKGIVNDAVESMNKAQQAYSDAVEKYGKDSKEASEAYEKLKSTIGESSSVFDTFQSGIDKVDTSEAVQKIETLGKSLDLSQYGDWDQAVEAVSSSIQEIKTSTETGLEEINKTYQGKLDELNEYKARNPLFSEKDYEIQKDIIISQWADDTQQLTTAAQQALDLYDSSLAKKLQDVADSAEKEWETSSPFKRWADRMGDKDDYVYSQMQNYVDKHLGETGLTKLINDAYAVLPNNTHQSAVSALTELVDDGAKEYERAVGTLNVDEMGRLTYTPYQKVLDSIPELVEYDSSSQAFIDKGINAAKLAAEGAHYDSIAQAFVDGEGNALLNSQTEFEDYNRMMAGYGVNAFSDEYKEKLTNNAETFEAIKAFGSETVDSYNSGIDENISKTETSITTWGNNIVQWFHDCGLKFGSPSQTMIDFGKDTVDGFNKGIEQNASSTQTSIGIWFNSIKSAVIDKMNEVKAAFNTILIKMLSGDGVDYQSPIDTLFTNISTAIQEHLSTLGDTLLNDYLPMFMETYITPFFSIDMWQPLFDTLLNEVFVTAFTTFCEWFNEQMTIWWDEYLVVWFTVEKWNELFDPLHKIFEQRYKTFIDWWVKAMKSWWEEKTMPYFKPEFWNEKVFNPLEKNRLDHHRKFIEWWDKALKSWWDENTMPYFKKEFWDEQIFTPLRENIQDHFKKFVEWWDDSMKSWWEGHVVPYFDEDLWKKLFNYVFLAADEVFTKVREKITERISEACEAVADGCNDMCESLQKVLDLIGEVMSALQGFGELGGSVTFNYSGEFATGGFPSAGSLFLAGETGAGAELVGNVGGKTGVVSNDEITGIAEAVYETGSQESVLLAQLIGLTKQLLDKEPVILGDKEIAEMANNGQSQLGMNIIS